MIFNISWFHTPLFKLHVVVKLCYPVDHFGLCIKVQSISFNLIVSWKRYGYDSGISVSMGTKPESEKGDSDHFRDGRAFEDYVGLHGGGNSDSEGSPACLRSPAKDQRTLNPLSWGSVISLGEAFSTLQSENTEMLWPFSPGPICPSPYKAFFPVGIGGLFQTVFASYNQTVTVAFYWHRQCQKPEILPILTLGSPSGGTLKRSRGLAREQKAQPFGKDIWYTFHFNTRVSSTTIHQQVSPSSKKQNEARLTPLGRHLPYPPLLSTPWERAPSVNTPPPRCRSAKGTGTGSKVWKRLLGTGNGGAKPEAKQRHRAEFSWAWSPDCDLAWGEAWGGRSRQETDYEKPCQPCQIWMTSQEQWWALDG